MKTRLIVAGAVLPVLFVVLFFLKPIFFGTLAAITCAIAVYEFMRVVCPNINLWVKISVMVCAAAINFAHLTEYSFTLTRLILVVLVVVVFIEGIRKFSKEDEVPFTEIICCIFAGFVYPLMIASIVMLEAMENGRFFALLPFVITFCCDGGAYFAGIFLGKHRITPVSPKKSVEGYVGGMVAGVACAMLYGAIVALTTELTVNFLALAVYGIVGSVAVEIGDLAYSLIKRQIGIKDYGNLIPGHGGMLDRFDSMSFAAPLICALVSIWPVFI